MKVKNRDLIFSTGKRVYAHNCIIGIGQDISGGVSYGGDGCLGMPDDSDWREDALTPAECVELADAMLERWQEFRAKWAAKVKP